MQECNRLSDNGHGVKVIDRCEEVRLAQCELLSCIVRCSMSKPEILDAYYSDFILALQSHTRDPFPELKIAASKLLTQILRVPQWEIGARHFATALARSAIPNMRHHSYSVRIASIGLFESSVSVPDRVKIKAAGSTAINDLVGFKEENVSNKLCKIDSVLCKIISESFHIMFIPSFYYLLYHVGITCCSFL